MDDLPPQLSKEAEKSAEKNKERLSARILNIVDVDSICLAWMELNIPTFSWRAQQTHCRFVRTNSSGMQAGNYGIGDLEPMLMVS
jgi:hypothetical protein